MTVRETPYVPLWKRRGGTLAGVIVDDFGYDGPIEDGSTVAASIDPEDIVRDDHGRFASKGGGDDGTATGDYRPTDTESARENTRRIDEKFKGDNDSVEERAAKSAKAKAVDAMAEAITSEQSVRLLAALTAPPPPVPSGIVPLPPSTMLTIEPGVTIGKDGISGATWAEYDPDGTLTVGSGDPPRGAATQGSPQFDEDLRHGAVSALVESWAQGTVQTPPIQAMMDVVADRFGVVRDPGGQVSPTMATAAKEFLDTAGRDTVEALVDHIYSTTQAKLAEDGVDEIALYRGMYSLDSTADYQAPAEPTTTPITMNPLSSWTTSDEIVANFTNTSTDYSSKRWGNESGLDPKPSGLVVAAVVPAEQVFSMAGTGVGSYWEHELVVIGTPTVATVASGDWYYTKMDTLPKTHHVDNGFEYDTGASGQDVLDIMLDQAAKAAAAADPAPLFIDDGDSADWLRSLAARRSSRLAAILATIDALGNVHDEAGRFASKGGGVSTQPPGFSVSVAPTLSPDDVTLLAGSDVAARRRLLGQEDETPTELAEYVAEAMVRRRDVVSRTLKAEDPDPVAVRALQLAHEGLARLAADNDFDHLRLARGVESADVFAGSSGGTSGVTSWKLADYAMASRFGDSDERVDDYGDVHNEVVPIGQVIGRGGTIEHEILVARDPGIVEAIMAWPNDVDGVPTAPFSTFPERQAAAKSASIDVEDIVRDDHGRFASKGDGAAKGGGDVAAQAAKWEPQPPFPLTDVRTITREVLGQDTKATVGRIAEGRPVIGYRGITSTDEIRGTGDGWKSQGKARNAAEDGTSFSTTPQDLFGAKAVPSWGGDYKDKRYTVQLAVDLQGLEFSTMVKPDENGAIPATRNLGLAITEPVPYDRILAVRELDPSAVSQIDAIGERRAAAVESTQNRVAREQGFADYPDWQHQLAGAGSWKGWEPNSDRTGKVKDDQFLPYPRPLLDPEVSKVKAMATAAEDRVIADPQNWVQHVGREAVDAWLEGLHGPRAAALASAMGFTEAKLAGTLAQIDSLRASIDPDLIVRDDRGRFASKGEGGGLRGRLTPAEPVPAPTEPFDIMKLLNDKTPWVDPDNPKGIKSQPESMTFAQPVLPKEVSADEARGLGLASPYANDLRSEFESALMNRDLLSATLKSTDPYPEGVAALQLTHRALTEAAAEHDFDHVHLVRGFKSDDVTDGNVQDWRGNGDVTPTSGVTSWLAMTQRGSFGDQDPRESVGQYGEKAVEARIPVDQVIGRAGVKNGEMLVARDPAIVTALMSWPNDVDGVPAAPFNTFPERQAVGKLAAALTLIASIDPEDIVRDERGRFANKDQIQVMSGDLKTLSIHQELTMVGLDQFRSTAKGPGGHRVSLAVAVERQFGKVLGVSPETATRNLVEMYDKARTTPALDADGKRTTVEEVGHRWYGVAHDIGSTLAEANGLPEPIGHALLAAASVNTGWDANVEWARRVADDVTNHSREPIPQPLIDQINSSWASFEEGRDARGAVKHQQGIEVGYRIPDGSTLRDLSDRAAAVVIGKKYDIPSSGLVGQEWAVSLARDPRPERIDDVLNGAKVRSFYNNINEPDRTDVQNVTMDRHMFRALVGGTDASPWPSDTAKALYHVASNEDTAITTPSYAGMSVGIYPLATDVVRAATAEVNAARSQRGESVLTANQVQAVCWGQQLSQWPEQAFREGVQRPGGRYR